jgi:hypothetical protein
MRKVTIFTALLLAVGLAPAMAATPSLSGKVIDTANKSIAGVKVNLLQS